MKKLVFQQRMSGPSRSFDRIKDFRMTDHLVDPWEEHVAAVAHLALDRAPGSRLIVLELAAKFGNLTPA